MIDERAIEAFLTDHPVDRAIASADVLAVQDRIDHLWSQQNIRAVAVPRAQSRGDWKYADQLTRELLAIRQQIAWARADLAATILHEIEHPEPAPEEPESDDDELA